MNKNLIILGIMLMVGFSFAVPIIPANPYFDNKVSIVWCAGVTMGLPMNASAYGYNKSYNSQIGALISSSRAAYNVWIGKGGPCRNRDLIAFNSVYNTVLMPDFFQETRLYFRAANDAVRSGSTNWRAVFAEYSGFQSDFRDCVASRPARNCGIA